MAKAEQPPRDLDELDWELEKLVRQGWSNEEILAAAKARTRKKRGRPRSADEERIAQIIAGKATAGKIAAGNDSVRRRLSGKARKAALLDRYRALLKEFYLIQEAELDRGEKIDPLLDEPPNITKEMITSLDGLLRVLRGKKLE
jgi:hypothetical protein